MTEFDTDKENEDSMIKTILDPHLFNFRQYDAAKGLGLKGLTRYEWTGKLEQFNRIIWAQQFKKPELKAELAKLAFESALSTTAIAMDLDDVRFHTLVVSEEDAKYREKYFCEKFWNFIVFIATDSIPANIDEKKVLLKIIDDCARYCFRDDLSRDEVELQHPSRAAENLGKKTTIQEVEDEYGLGFEWEKLKPFIRNNDELWAYDTDQESWDHLAGESGVALVRDGEIIASIMIEIS
ncbi:hypothetical protein [Desulfofustis glycolicus]|uniref:Uncharacterized protein n=1 Tax=Desulfofustis glycolicus DSM 9705 TaxID=1121409 RepID=A0A1M5XC24_9BACT|nr:hypothetical protein [Desulfofustis glycolicus]SHH97360.1 hypothetical protein SAMN02745124_02940 [Desulfofustis glycolicus DSM 9705]